MSRLSTIDALFARAREGDTDAFAEWMGCAERPIRASLFRFAQAADLEVVMQETFLRMWLMATRPGAALAGENASLRMALGVARNVAREEVRRSRRGTLVPLDDVVDAPELSIEPDPGPDPGLARAIHDCIERIPARHRSALVMRIMEGAARPDHDLAGAMGLKLNTFLQHVVRARRSLRDCLERKGVELAGVGS